MFKNVASQKIAIFAYDKQASAAKTGDAANITGQISLEGAASAATNDVNPTELDATDHPGIYLFDMTQDETNANLVIVTADSSTSNIDIEPVMIYTQTAMRGTDSAALATVCTEGRLAELDAANIPADVDAILTDTGTTIPASITTAQTDLDTLTGADGATLATLQANYAPSTHAAADVVTALFAKTGITAGGSATYEDMMKAVYSMARGKITKSGDAYTFLDDDDTTPLFTLTISTSARTVA